MCVRQSVLEMNLPALRAEGASGIPADRGAGFSDREQPVGVQLVVFPPAVDS